MPKQYEAIRDSLIERGYSEEEAKRIAAATWNKHHPEDPVGRNYESNISMAEIDPPLDKYGGKRVPIK
jgi:hypothetical protein